MRDQRPVRAACVFRPTPAPACYRFSDFGGWHGLVDSGGIPMGVFPERVCLETMFCALAAACDGCGSTCGLRITVEVRGTSYGERDVACATLCGDCAGGSLVQMLGSGGFSRAALHHSRHQLRR
jgi:hypothetical protein